MVIRAVFLDLGGTLIDENSFEKKHANVINQCLLKKVGINLSLDKVEKLRRKVKKYLDKKYDGNPIKHKDGVFFFTMCKLLGKKIRFEEAKLLEEHFYREKLRRVRLMKGCIKVLKELKNRNLKLVLISNGSERRVMRYLKKFKLTRFFHKIIISENIGKEKSTGYPFMYALKILNLKPEEVLMVGDKIEEDIIPAKKLGINAIRICKSLKERKKFKKFYHIRNLKEIIKIIENKETDRKSLEIFKYVIKYYKSQDIFHNLSHLLQTLKFATYLAEKENANKLIVKLGVLLHQFHNPTTARRIMKKVGIDKEIMKEVEHCVECISRKTIHKAKTIEAKVVFDADKLQMIGVFGLIRWCFGKRLNEKMLRETFAVEEDVYKNYLRTKTAKKIAKKLRRDVRWVKKNIYKFLDYDNPKIIRDIKRILTQY